MREESLAATASAGHRWLLVEVAGAWGWSAFTGSKALDPELGRTLVRRAEGAGMRILAIRRPGRARRAGRWRWAIVDSDPGTESVRWGEAVSPDALLDDPFAPEAGEPSADPIIAVCAHGRHDECCAVRGRRVAADVAGRFPDYTWECSHIGGDRFAATMLLFPHGLNYGRVDHAHGPHLVDEYLAGRIELEHYRGRTAYSRHVQAAVHAASAQLGDRRIDAFQPVSAKTAEHGWIVDLESEHGLVVVELAERLSDPLFTMCTATEPVRVRSYEPVSVDVVTR